jgi:hypothetical protein
MSFDNTQLTTLNHFKTQNIIFGKLRDGTTKRIPIGVKNPDGTTGEFVLETLDLYSFGLQQNMKYKTKEPDGSYSLVMCLYNKDAPTDEQKKWVETFNDIVEYIKHYIIEQKASIGKPRLILSDLRDLNPIFLKKDPNTGEPAVGATPMLYIKVLQDKKTGHITTPFESKDGSDVDPLTLIGKHCNVRGAIKFESVHIGNSISIQVRLYNAEVQIKDNSIKRLLRRPVVNENVVMEAAADDSKEEAKNNESESESDDDNGSIKGDEEEEKKVEPVVQAPVAAAKPAAKRPINRRG